MPDSARAPHRHATQYTSREAYYEHVLSGKATSQKDRIMRWFIQVRRPATRHEALEFFCKFHPPRAQDGGSPIPWQSLGGAIAGMVCRRTGCDHRWPCDAYLAVDHEGPCPVTRRLSQFLTPIGDRWAQRKLFS
jgi:hypothetical protein